MKVVAVIPARGGSKRVPGKNMRSLWLRPLIAWSIEAAKAAGLVDRVIVSTDDDATAEAADIWGAEVHRRPAYTATDDAPIESALWSVHQMLDGAYDYMVTLQPTCPVRRPGLIDDCIKRCLELDADSVWTAQAEPKCWFWEMDTPGEWMDQTAWKRLGPAQQRHHAVRTDLLWRFDGSVVVSHESLIRRKRDRTGGRSFPFLTEKTVDIDVEADFAVAEALLKAARKVEAA